MEITSVASGLRRCIPAEPNQGRYGITLSQNRQIVTMSSVDSAEFSYAYKSSLMGAPFEFRLAPDALEWRKGGIAGRTPYGRIRRIRLSFRPMTMQNYRFRHRGLA